MDITLTLNEEMLIALLTSQQVSLEIQTDVLLRHHQRIEAEKQQLDAKVAQFWHGVEEAHQMPSGAIGTQYRFDNETKTLVPIHLQETNVKSIKGRKRNA